MHHLINMYRGFPRAIYFIALSRFITATGSFVFPFLTLLLTQKLGMSAASTGMTLFIASSAYIPGSLLGGKLADTIGRKPVLLIAESLMAVSWIVCGFVPESQLLIPAIAVAYFCMGAFDPTSTALMSDLSTPDNRKAVFSLSYLGWNMGYAVGPLIAGLLFLNHSQWMFWGDGLTTLVATVLIVFFVNESKPDPTQKAHNSKEAAVSGSVWRVIAQRPYLIFFTIAGILTSMIYAQLNFSLPLQLSESFGDQGPRYFGLLMSLNGLVVVLMTAPIISLTKKVPPLVSILLGASLYGLGFAFLGHIASLSLFMLLLAIFTLGEILDSTNRGVYIANHSPQSHRGRINGLLPLIMGFGYAAAPILVGPIIDARGIEAVWPLVGWASVLAMLIFAALQWFEHRRNLSESKETAQTTRDIDDPSPSSS